MFKTFGLTHNIKLVRGAYLFGDRKYDIIHDTKEETDTNYNNAVKMLQQSPIIGESNDECYFCNPQQDIHRHVQTYSKTEYPSRGVDGNGQTFAFQRP